MKGLTIEQKAKAYDKVLKVLQLLYIKMEEIEIKLEIFKAIANNSSNLCSDNKYIPPKGVAIYTNEVYEILTKKE